MAEARFTETSEEGPTVVSGEPETRQDAAALAIEYVALADIRPDARNARTHSPKQVKQIAKSITQFGFMKPIVVDEDGVILAGHGAYAAAAQLNLARLPVIRHSHLSPKEKRAYNLADNRLALNSGWDMELLSIELKDLAATDIDLRTLGFSSLEIGRMVDGVTLENSAATAGLEYRIVVECNDEAHQRQLLEQLESDGLTCRPLIS